MQDKYAMLVDRYLEAAREDHARRIREDLARVGRPVVASALRRFQCSGEELEDLSQQALLHLLDGIDRVRREGGRIPNPVAYAKTIAARCVVDRRRGPRDVFAKSLVYLAQRCEMFAVWSLGRETMIGLVEDDGLPMRATAAFLEFDRDPARFTHRALGGESPLRAPRAKLLLATLQGLGTPLPKAILASRLADAVGIPARGAEGTLPDEIAAHSCPDPIGLGEVWKAMQSLGRNARACFLLARSHDEVAALVGESDPCALLPNALEMAADECARLWPNLPLDDEEIATRLGTSRANVHTLRCRAVARLRGELAEWWGAVGA